MHAGHVPFHVKLLQVTFPREAPTMNFITEIRNYGVVQTELQSAVHANSIKEPCARLRLVETSANPIRDPCSAGGTTLQLSRVVRASEQCSLGCGF